MKSSFRYLGLLLGMILVILSFLFFGRRQEIYMFLMLGGLVMATAFYLVILISKGHWKEKIAWSVIVIAGFVFQQLSEPAFNDSSYRIYINQHKKELAEINDILDNTSGDVTILNNSIIHPHDQFPKAVMDKLLERRRKLGVYIIAKTDHEIYYGLGGFLDERQGITYWTEKYYPDMRYRHLIESWFR